MSKKSVTQSKSKQKLKAEDIKIPDYWLNELAGLEINKDNWNCHVSILVESDSDATVFIEHFNEACQNGIRKEIQVISMYEILRTVTLNLFNKENAQKSKTPFVVLCHEIHKCLGPNNDGIIPTDMLAALIKYLILQYKDFNIRQKMEIFISSEAFEEVLHKEICDKLQMFAVATTGQSKPTKGANKITSKITPKKTADKKTTKMKNNEEKCKEHNIKITSKLRRRGEEWKDTKWVDDAPEEGPQLYVIISTFHLANLPQELLKLGVPLNSVVKVNILPNDNYYNFYSVSNISNFHLQEELLDDLKAFKQQSAPYLKTTIKQHFTDEELNLIEAKLNIKRFWKQLQQIIYNKENILQFNDVMFIQFTPDITKLDFEQTNFQNSIYDQISFLLYQLFDFTEYHKHYLNQVKVVDVYDSVVCSLQDKDLYKTIMESVPSEFVNIPFVLHALLCQVDEMCNGSDKNEFSDRSTHDTSLNTNTNKNINIIKLKSLLHDLNNQNDLFYTENKMDLLDQLSSEVAVLKILSHSNKIESKMFNFEDIGQYIEDITLHILQTTWKYILSSQCTTDVESLCDSYYEALSECEKHGHDSSNLIYYFLLVLLDKEINNKTISAKRSFIQIVDEYLHLWPVDSSESIQSKDNEPLFKQNNCSHNTDSSVCSEISEDSRISKTEDSIKLYSNRDLNATRKKLSLNKYKYFEELCPSDILQLVQELHFESNTLQYKHFPCTDQKLLLIYNTLCSKTKFNECYQMTKLRSEVGLRDFVEFILSEERDWIQNLQASSDINIPFNLKSFQSATKSNLVNDVSKLFDLSQCDDRMFISKNSLKHTEQSVPPTEVHLKSPKQRKKSKPTTQDKPKKSIEIKKKEKDKSIKDDNQEIEPDVEVPIKSYDFLGYELGPPVRVQFSGFTREIVLPHECKLIVNTLKRLYKSESVGICVAKCGYKLYFHNDEENKNGSFHINHKSGAIIHFCKNKETDRIKTEIPPDADHDFCVNHQVHAESGNISGKSQAKEIDYSDEILLKTELDNLVIRNDFDIHSEYNVNLSLPSGLLIHVVNDIPGVFYIKQMYLVKGPMSAKVAEENFRCLLKNGTVIKYLTNGYFEILCPNSMIYRCKDFEWTYETTFDKDSKDKTDITDEASQNVKKQPKFDTKKSKTTPLKLDTIKTTPKSKKLSLKPEDIKTTNKNIVRSDVSSVSEVPYLISRKYKPIYYDIIHSDGKQMTFKDNIVTSGDTLFILETNSVNEEIRRVERADCTELQYVSDGMLIVHFYDGTRITTKVSEDQHELFCDWTESEYSMWFLDKIVDAEDTIQDVNTGEDTLINSLSVNITNGSAKSTFSKTSDMKNSIKPLLENSISLQRSRELSNKSVKIGLQSSVSAASNEIKLTKKTLLKDDGYIVINMSYTIEHPNYAAVTYDYQNFHLELPTDISVTTCPLGKYMVQLGSEIVLTTGTDKITFNCVSENSEILLNTVIHTETFVEPDTLIDALCISRDETGNKVIISREGNIHQHSGLKLTDSTQKGVEELNCFVLNHNFSGFKFLHKTELSDHIEAVMHSGGLHRKYNNLFSTNFTSIPVLSSETDRWVMSYQETSASREVNFPSSYGENNSYLFPFRRKTPSTCTHTELPNTVMIRLIHRLPPLSIDTINCCLRIFNAADIESDNAHLKLCSPKYNPKTTDFNVSVIKNDPELLSNIYEESRKHCENKGALDLLREKEIHNILHKVLYKIQKSQEKENNDFMRYSLREHIVPPYFSSPMGQMYDMLFNIINKIVSADRTFNGESVETLLTLCDEVSSRACLVIPEEITRDDGSDENLITLCEKMSFSIPEETVNHHSREDDFQTLCEEPTYSIPEETIRHQSSDDILITLCDNMSYSTPEKAVTHFSSEDDTNL